MSKKDIPERIGTQGWEQFLAAKQEMLYQFELAKKFSQSHIVQVSHGNVAELLFREWLKKFLPKKFGVTSGYIVSQNLERTGLKLPHYDVIIYDQLNSPILWVEGNHDQKIKAIPAEFVHMVFEVKSNLTTDSSKKAIEKLNELIPLLYIDSKEDSCYKGRLPKIFCTGVVFFEAKKENEYKQEVLYNLIPNENLPFYGGIVLSGEGRNIDDSGILRLLHSTTEIKSAIKKGQQSILVHGTTESDSKPTEKNVHLAVMLLWSPPSFSMFAFDLIAIMEGTYRMGYLSSNYGMSWLNPKRENK
jgi:hypothetical protein